PPVKAPEKMLTLLALRLAALEKMASGIGTLAFLWATIVLLGGFAVTLSKSDLWFITLILVNESTRVFGRSRELEWQHHSTWYVSEIRSYSRRALAYSSTFVARRFKSMFQRNPTSPKGVPKRDRSPERKKFPMHGMHRRRTLSSSEVSFCPGAKWLTLSKNVSNVLYWIQLFSASACLILSTIKLARRDFGSYSRGELDKRNRNFALMVFYILAVAEALLFLMEKAYWEWNFSVERLLETAAEECELEDYGIVSVRRFFYDAYSKCIDGSVFDGLKMDMVSYAVELVGSRSPEERLMGVRILRKFSTSPRFSEDTLGILGVDLSVMERLLEMLNWTDPEEAEIRYSAAEILSELAGRMQNSQRMAGIPGAMVSISSLLHVRPSSGARYEVSEKILPMEDDASWELNHIGILILEKLAGDPDVCEKIGNAKGLLPTIVDFMQAGERLLTHRSPSTSHISTVKRALQVVKTLAGNCGVSGKRLRKDILEMVFVFGYIRDILRCGGKHPDMQTLAIGVLTNLAMEEEAAERVANTGGLLAELFTVFFDDGIPENAWCVRGAAGEAMSMLTLDNENVCRRICAMDLNGKLVEALEIPFLCVNAARILRNACISGGEDRHRHLHELTQALPIIFKAMTTSNDEKVKEAMMGAAAMVVELLPSEIVSEEVGTESVARVVSTVLEKYEFPSVKVPNIRRYAVELSVGMMTSATVEALDLMGLEEKLASVMKTTSELESFSVFCGTVGVCRHRMSMPSLVEAAMKKLLQE
ncbi:hypothetical protein M569_08988, partial [Genlisea aurea]